MATKKQEETLETARPWAIQVYRPDGTWAGFFQDVPTAQAWVAKRENAKEYEITVRKPSRGEA